VEEDHRDEEERRAEKVAAHEVLDVAHLEVPPRAREEPDRPVRRELARDDERQGDERERQETAGDRQIEAEREREEVRARGDRAVTEDGRGEAVRAHAGHPIARRSAAGRISASAPHTVSTSASRIVPKKGRARQVSPAASVTGKSP
jgi:hypothetical protein